MTKKHSISPADRYPAIRDLLGGPAPPSRVPVNTLFSWMMRLQPLLALLPEVLIQRDREVLGGYIFPEGRELLECITSALRHHRSDFPDVPEDPDDLDDMQYRADAFFSLQKLFLLMADRAGDHATYCQGQGVFRAFRVLRHVRADSARVFGAATPRERRRRLAMLPAEAALSARNVRTTPTRTKK